MRKVLYCFALSVFALLLSCDKDPYTYAEIETDMGTMTVRLYNTAPRHRNNFVKLAKEGFYDGLLFHRVIPDFMIQGGDPDSRDAAEGQRLGMGGPGYEIDPEIGAYHFKGALAAARLDDMANPQRRSSGSQFFIVQGNPVQDFVLDRMEETENIRYTPEERARYRQMGGTPFLDNKYTVFGEVVEGLEVLDRIAAVPKDANDRPLQDIRMKVNIRRKGLF